MVSVKLFLICALTTLALVFADNKDDFIDGEYFLVIKENTIQSQEDNCIKKLEKEYNITHKRTFNMGSVRMLFVAGSAGDVGRASKLPEIEFVEQNVKVSATSDAIPRFCHKVAAPGSWGLDRIDQTEKLPYTNHANILATYTMGPYRGAGVMAYIVDTGIQISHPEFGNRAYCGYSAHGLNGNCDAHFHGTHVAGVVGSASYGVAKEVVLMAVKVLGDDGLGTSANVIDGLEWIWNNHNSEKSGGNIPKSVVNLSIAGAKHECTNLAIKALFDAGIVVVASAGSFNADACNLSPSSAPEAITLAATNTGDKIVPYTNWGMCVDVHAPGENIRSTGLFGTNFSGSSRAAPHVTGVVALKLSKETMTPTQITSWIKSKAISGKLGLTVAEQGASPNLLLSMDCMLS